MSDLSPHHGKGKANLPDVRIHEKADARSSVDHPRRNDWENLPDGHNPVAPLSRRRMTPAFVVSLGTWILHMSSKR
jgi:hypothetical protein